jgi:hypothetical protein
MPCTLGAAGWPHKQQQRKKKPDGAVSGEEKAMAGREVLFHAIRKQSVSAHRQSK